MKTQPTDHLDTLAVHAGQEPDPTTGAIMTPIYQTSTYVQSAPGEHKGYEYSRTDNPTRTALQANIAALEGGAYGLAFASGLAATDTLLRLYGPGDHVIVGNDVYGGTYRLFEQVLRRYGLEFSYVDVTDPAAVASAIRPETRLIWLETPTNPLLAIADIEDIARRARGSIAGEHIRIAVDNTFASPYLQRPLELGADVVVHSTTKYIGGHSDVVGGALVVSDAELGERLAFHQNAMGAVAGPFDAWLTLRGLKTLSVRMDRHCANAERIVEMLERHPAVREVLYPGLPGHPGHEIAAKQMKAFGGMVSFRMESEEAAVAVCERTKLFTLGESLGGVESLIEHPGRMTHASAAGSPLEVPGDLVRLSVGIEDADDLIRDLRRALPHGS